MKLYIAEKPSLGRAIADALPKPHKRCEGYIQTGNGDCVSWCIGHLLEQAEPEAYDGAYKQWRAEHLPIVPQQWQLRAKASTKKQLGVLRQLVKQAQLIVHAGDPDREGQLLVDEVIDFLKVSGAKRQQIQRCLISDLNLPAVQKALANLRDNREFIPLATSALARARADWLYGINMTRAYTLQGRKVGYQGVLSVGRVQTPLLGLVVRRDEAIEAFVSKPYFEVVAHLLTGKGEGLKAQWVPSEACLPYQDDEGRVLSKALAENVVRRITGQPAEVTALSQTPKSQAAPLPFNLSALQIDAARKYGMSAQQVLDLAQQLYERHKLITYPRSDCRYLPEEHFQQRSQVLAAVAQTCSALAAACQNADTALRSKAWNDSKVDAHHAIIPTARSGHAAALSDHERKLYELIARNYLAQFYPAYRYLETKAEFRIAGGLFRAQARQTQEWGWKQLWGKTEPQVDDEPELPPLKVGDQLTCERGELLEKHTQPPLPFSDATLLAAMTGIARYVSDPELRKVLRETDGLGTEATRAGIIELLFKRGFLQRQGKNIRATEAGKGLIASLPDVAVLPDMTARWERLLNAISLREENYRGFMGPLEQQLQGLIQQSQQHLPHALSGVAANKPASKRRKSGYRKVAPKSNTGRQRAGAKIE
ncbi:MAG: DNA topoisomerase III [Hahellaceae bacterium]|nr:DNA topoisomerase III [Hahellaceae bacterium]MCP5169622.1 DNA topoisomerase III [Hahellaceae bacterium]